MPPMSLSLSLALGNQMQGAAASGTELSIVSLTPADDETGVDTDVVLIVEFDAAVTIGTGQITIEEDVA